VERQITGILFMFFPATMKWVRPELKMNEHRPRRARRNNAPLHERSREMGLGGRSRWSAAAGAWSKSAYPARVVEWLPFVNVGLVWIWFLCLHLIWFLGARSTSRSRIGWVWGTPVLLALTGLFVGGAFDYGCVIVWGPSGGLVGLVTGAFLGAAMARGSEEK
jgi:hypothetical protein